MQNGIKPFFVHLWQVGNGYLWRHKINQMERDGSDCPKMYANIIKPFFVVAFLGK